MADLPVGRGGLARRKAIDSIVDEAVTGNKAAQRQRQKPSYAREPTPERNATYDDMESRIYGDKSAKAKK